MLASVYEIIDGPLFYYEMDRYGAAMDNVSYNLELQSVRVVVF